MKQNFITIFLLIAGTLLTYAQQWFPVRERQEVTSLDGTWQFRLDGQKEWRSIAVPGNWERQGVKKPEYGRNLSALHGTYKRTFMYDEYWKGRDVILRLDGVQNGFVAYINGKEAGRGHSAHNIHQFDVTPYLQEGENEIVVKVSSQSDYWLFDVCDAWSNTGIQHSVELFSVPKEASVADVVFVSKVNHDNTADITITTKVNGKAALLTASLIDERNNHVCDLQGKIADGVSTLRGHLLNPRLWTAETPNLYRLDITLYDAKGKKQQSVEDRVGVREIKVENCQILLNNRPIFLRGVCLSENDAIEGSAMSVKTFRKILCQMKAANINFIRTAHYPLNPAFNDLCDEMGFYVCEEIPFASRGKEYLNRNDATVIQELKDRAKATIDRDRNRPSIIIWSHGNENELNAPQDSCLKYTMGYDPSRLRGVPQAKGAFLSFIEKPSQYVDVICGHYATDGVLAKACKLSSKPLINTEYAHSSGTSTGELEHKYDIFRREPKIAGGSIWSFEDQSMLTYNYNQQNQVEKGVRVDSLRYIDCYGLNPAPEESMEKGKEGTDGIVYGNLYPSEDYFLVAQVYSPVKLTSVVKGNEVKVTVANEHDFIPLRGFQIQWQTQNYKEAKNQGAEWLTAEAGTTEDITIPTGGLSQGLILAMNILRPDGSLCYQKNVLLDTLTDYGKMLAEGPAHKVMKKGYDVLDDVLKHGFMLRVGRPITFALDYHRKGLWPEYMIAPKDVKTKKRGGAYNMTCRWENPAKPQCSITGTFDIKVMKNGTVDVTYQMTPSDSIEGKFLDFGVSMAMPKEFTDVAWLGQGPYSHSADKHAYNNPGCWQLNKEDLRFWGNRGETRLLTAYSPATSVSMVTDNGDIFTEDIDGRIYLTDNLNVCTYGTKFNSPKPSDAKDMAHSSGHFVIRQNATELNQKVFGPFSPSNPENPFLSSYGK